MFAKLIFFMVFVMMLEAKHTSPLRMDPTEVTVSEIKRSTSFFRNDYVYDSNSEAFYKFHEEKKKWSDAVFECAAEGAQLAAPFTEKEKRDLIKYINGSSDVYLGFHDMFKEGTFMTLNGTVLSAIFSNWLANEPNDPDGSEDCVKMAYDGFYSDVKCDIARNFICKKDLATLTRNPVCETYDTGYIFSSKMNRCYKVHTAAKNWFDAYKTCLAEQSQLGIINSADEAAFYVETLKSYPLDSLKGVQNKNWVFLDFSDLVVPGDFRTSSGQSLSEVGYEEWINWQPDNAGGVEHCGTINRDGKLNDLRCDIKCIFICERTLGRAASYDGMA